MGKMTFNKSGFFTSIQDTGRFGFRKYGVPVSGAMDLQNAWLANLLVNNKSDFPVLEITLSGPEIHFNEEALVAISGADLSPRLNNVSITMNTAIQIKPGQVLSFGKPQYGVRAYLAVKGGFEIEKVLNSYSRYVPVTGSVRIENGYELEYQNYSGTSPNAAVKPDMAHFQNDLLEVTPGPEYGKMDDHLKEMVSEEKATIGENNRMGYQLSVDHPMQHNRSMITVPVVPGTVQLTPSGKLIVLMRDGQVTGGYPRVLQLTDQSINRLAQKRTGEVVRFRIKSE